MKFLALIMLMKLGTRILTKNIYSDDSVPFKSTSIESPSGFDSSFSNNINIVHKEIWKINKYIEIQKLIKTLEDCENNDLKKISILNKYSFLFNDTLNPNMLAAGLMDDYDFEFF